MSLTQRLTSKLTRQLTRPLSGGVSGVSGPTDFVWPVKVDPLTIGFISRLATIRTEILSNIPTEFDRAYYFSTSGDDSTGDGSIENPWQTVAKAQAEIEAAEAATESIAVYFKRGDHWKDVSAGLKLSGTGSLISAYGTGDKPIISTGSAVTTWTDAGGGVHSKVMPEPQWLYRSGIFNAALEFAGTTTTPASGQWSYNSGTAYINLGGDDPDVVTIDALPFVDDDGVSLNSSSDNCSARNLICVGFGINRSDPVTQKQPFVINCDSGNLGVIKGCEGYYAGHHLFQVLGNNGGVQLFDDCDAGWLINHSSSGSTIYNSYKLNGGQYTLFNNCRVPNGGNLIGANDTSNSCTAFFSHTGSGKIGEFLVVDCEVSENLTGRVNIFANYGGVDAVSELDNTGTAFCVGCTFGRTALAASAHWQDPPAKMCWINGEWHVFGRVKGTNDAWFTDASGKYYAVNTIGTVEYHAGYTRSNQGWFNFSSLPSITMANLINCVFRVIDGGSVSAWFWNRDGINSTNEFGLTCGGRGTIYWIDSTITSRYIGWHDSVDDNGNMVADMAYRNVASGTDELGTTTHLRVKTLSIDPDIAAIKAGTHVLADYSDDNGMARIVEYDASGASRSAITSVGPYKASDE